MIDIATLKEYIKVLEVSSLASMELSDGSDTIRLEKPAGAAAVQLQTAAPVAVAAAAAEAAVVEAPAPQPAPAAEKTVNAPIVGVFYAAPSPESEPYAVVGQRVKKGDVLCIIEAMKCMNEIQAEEDGEITAVLANNGELVEYDQPLFGIK